MSTYQEAIVMNMDVQDVTSEDQAQRVTLIWSQLTRILHLALAAASWVLLVAAVAEWILIRWLGDVWWPGTLQMYAPRWPLFAPWLLLTVICAAFARKLLWVQLATALVLCGPVLGLCLPVMPGWPHDGEFRLKVMSVNSGNAPLEGILADVQQENPDVIAFQEIGNRAPQAFHLDGWHWQIGSDMAIASRFPILDSKEVSGNGIDRWGTVALLVRLQLPVGEVRFCCLHLNTPRHGLDAMEFTRRGIFGIDDMRKSTESRNVQSQAVRKWIGNADVPTIIAGDFNMPVESAFYRRDWSGFQNSFSTAGWGYGHSKFTRWWGVRIDHILTDGNWRVISCRVASPTGGDHRPVVAELALKKS